ncbi:hypothetical protein [Pseudophaeobacter sp.]|uniref:hypothetical protein n=1 Tax=Pseudophaeobacter sp. TaxID=1971739 RepID=UPI0032999DE7
MSQLDAVPLIAAFSGGIKGKKISEVRFTEENAQVRWRANEGIRVSQIVDELQAKVFDQPQHASMRDELLALWADLSGTEKLRCASLDSMGKKL